MTRIGHLRRGCRNRACGYRHRGCGCRNRTVPVRNGAAPAGNESAVTDIEAAAVGTGLYLSVTVLRQQVKLAFDALGLWEEVQQLYR